MKKLLLLASAFSIALGANAQKATFTGDLNQISTDKNTPGVAVPVSGNKTAKSGDTLSRSHIPANGRLVYYAYPNDSGIRSGFNAYGDRGWVERFDVNGRDSAVRPLAVFGYLVGRSSASSTKTVRAGIWAQGSKTLVSGKVYFGGRPTTLLQSTTISMPSLRESTTTGLIDTVILMRFPTVGSNIADSFFAGFDIPTPYNWKALGGDTLALVQDTAGRSYGDGLAVSPLYTVSGGDTIINVQNATLSTAGTWDENYFGGGNGLYNNFFIGVIFRVQYLSVTGVTRNDLTVYGTVPNPAVNNTSLKISLQVPTQVMMQVTDIAGRVVYNAAAQNLGAGTHQLPIATDALASGTYYAIVRTATGSAMGIEFVVAK